MAATANKKTQPQKALPIAGVSPRGIRTRMTNKARRAQDETMRLDPARLWTFEEAKYYLRVGDSTLRSYLRSGRLKAYRVGGSEKGRLILFKKEDLDELIVPYELDEAEVARAENPESED